MHLKREKKKNNHAVSNKKKDSLNKKNIKK